jgi:4'-phosphopantetheinyl transferase
MQYEIVNISKIKHLCLLRDISGTYAGRSDVNIGYIEKYLTPEEISYFFSKRVVKRQIEWLAGRIAAKNLVAKIMQVPPYTISIQTNSYHAPYLPDYPMLDINISHSNDVAVAVISLQPGKKIGVDVELISGPRPDRFLDLAFTEKEKTHIKTQPKDYLYYNWTAKEAYLKFLKSGFHENLRNVEIIDKTIFHNHVKVEHITLKQLRIENYVLSIVTN